MGYGCFNSSKGRADSPPVPPPNPVPNPRASTLANIDKTQRSDAIRKSTQAMPRQGLTSRSSGASRVPVPPSKVAVPSTPKARLPPNIVTRPSVPKAPTHIPTSIAGQRASYSSDGGTSIESEPQRQSYVPSAANPKGKGKAAQRSTTFEMKPMTASTSEPAGIPNFSRPSVQKTNTQATVATQSSKASTSRPSVQRTNTQATVATQSSNASTKKSIKKKKSIREFFARDSDESWLGGDEPVPDIADFPGLKRAETLAEESAEPINAIPGSMGVKKY